jgi:hypothetical protein
MANWATIKDIEGDTYILNLKNITYLAETVDTVKIYLVDGMAIKATKQEAEGILNEIKTQKTSRGC